MNAGNRFFRISITLLVIATLAATIALARVGGGQRYGSGGSSSGNGGDGLGILVYFLLRLCIEQPCIGIPLVIIIIIVSVIAKKQKTKKQFAAIQQAGNRNLNRLQKPEAMKSAMESLKGRDPSFSEAAFTGTVTKAFMELQQAWSQQNLKKAKRFVSDGVLQRFTIQLEMQKAQGFRNNMEDSRVHSCEIAAVESDRHFDTIHVKITASGTDTDVDLKTGRKIRNNFSGTFVEYWSFVRRPGAQTLAGRGLVEGGCPNCGAALELSEKGRCSYCDAMVTSGEYDWVLTEITQSAEWAIAPDPGAIPGYAAISAGDPGFNLQIVEDTVSVIFWRYIQSYFENRADPMHKVSLDSCTETIRKAIENTTEGDSHLFFKNAAVGAVEVQEIITGSDHDRAAVLVKWSASNCWLESLGRIRGCGPQTIRPQLFNLVRKAGVQTIASMGLHSAHCTGCGAPYTGRDSGQCEYCGRLLNDGSGSWVLESITAFTGSRVNAARVSPVSGNTGASPDILLLAMAGVMHADGKMDPKEIKTLEDFASHRGISRERLDMILATVSEDGEGIPAPQNSAEAMEILRAMIRMSLSDGTIDEGEKSVLEAYARKAGLSGGAVSSEITRQRKKLYREVKESGN